MWNYNDYVRYIATEYREEFEYLAYSNSLYHWRDVYDTLSMLIENDPQLASIIDAIPVPYLDFKTLCVDICEYLNSQIVCELERELIDAIKHSVVYYSL